MDINDFSDTGSVGDESSKNDASQMTSKKEQKRRPKPKDGKVLYCGVCGDRALGYNFDAVSCESCKAFFRRNALKIKPFMCSFEGNCVLDAHSRKFCSGCRLQKCFAIGMKKTWILGAEQLQKRRERQQHRRHQQQGSTDSTICTSSTSGDSIYDDWAVYATSPNPCQSSSDFVDETTTLPSAQFCHTPSYVPYPPPPPSNRSPFASSEIHSPSSTTSHFEITSPTTHNSQFMVLKLDSTNGKGDQIEEKCLDLLEGPSSGLKEQFDSLGPIRLKRENPSDVQEDEELQVKPLNPYIRESLEDLCKKYTDVFDKPYTAEEIVKFMKPPQSVDHLYNMTDIFIRRLIRFTKYIPEFKSLTQDDQIVLLKGGIMELFVLRSCVSFDAKKESFKFQAKIKSEDGETLVHEGGVRKSILNTIGSPFIENHMSLIYSLQEVTGKDLTMQVLIFVIQLMSPQRPNMKDFTIIREAQERHLTWLKAYIRSRHDGHNSEILLAKLLKKMEEVHELGKANFELLVDVDVSRLEPILVEIFELRK